jgi:hypothetical protein
VHIGVANPPHRLASWDEQADRIEPDHATRWVALHVNFNHVGRARTVTEQSTEKKARTA